MERMKACRPCSGLDATPQTILTVKGRCDHCGYNGMTTEGVTLYVVPKRPAPGSDLKLVQVRA